MPAPHRTGIPQARHRALKSFALEVMLVQRSFQPPPLPTVRVVGGHVVLALARHVEARLLQGGDDAGPVLHRAALDAPQQVVPDLVPGIGLMRDLRPQLPLPSGPSHRPERLTSHPRAAQGAAPPSRASSGGEAPGRRARGPASG